MAQLISNNTKSVLASDITNVATSLIVASGEGARFPAISGSDFFLVTLFDLVDGIELNHEIVKCTARSTDTLTIVRAQEGTTARAFVAGTSVQMRFTAGALSDLNNNSILTKTLHWFNAAGTYKNIFTSTATAERTHTFPDMDNTLISQESIHAATGKTTPVDADELALIDSAASNVLKKLTWANLKATLKTYFDTLYLPKASGAVLQVLVFSDDGSAISDSAFVNTCVSTKNVYPKSSNSTLIVECVSSGIITAGGAGTNTEGSTRLYYTTGTTLVGNACIMGVVSGSGTNVQTEGTFSNVAFVSNSNLDVKGFLLHAKYLSTACNISATSQQWKITEVQN